MRQYKKIYKTIPDGKINLIARLAEVNCQRFGFETSLNGEKFEINNNMPMFYTEDEAYKWIENQLDWKRI